MKILAINGSISDQSLNGQLLEAIQKQFEGTLDIELVDLKPLPIFKEHQEESDPAPVLELAEKIDAADGIMISTPEYNHSIPSSLKSALEWMSYNVHPFENKPVLIVGASTSEQGSARAQTNLRKVLEAPGVNAIAMPGNEFLFGNAEGRFDETGRIKDESTRKFIESVVKKFVRFIDAVSVLQVPEDVEFEPGTYVAEAEGHNGPIPIKVTFSKTRIESIEIDSSNETKGIADVVFERVPEAIIANQTLNVDTVSGASVTQEAVIDGIADAVDQAGGNVDVLRKRPKIAREKAQEIKEVKTDVVVVGGGGAGLAAAASAIQNGAKVIVLDKFPAIGGNTNRTGGPMNAADPEWQTSISALPGEDHTLEDIIDTPLEEIHEEYQEDFLALREEVKEYLAGDKDYLFDSWRLHLIQTYLGGKRVDLEGNEVYGDYDLVKTLTSNALDSVHWLEEIGVSFDYSEPQMPVGALWRRGHKPLANEGYAYIEALSNYITENGGEIITDTQVTELTKKGDKIVGLEAVDSNEDRLIVKADAVVMASGGFGSNTPMLQEYNTYWTEIADDIATSNSPAITGDGIKLGEDVGADLVDMGLIQMLPTCDPKTGALFVGLQVPPANFIMVNQEGRRFVNEFGGRDEISQAAIENGGLFWLIADENIKSTAMNTNEDKIRKEIENGDLFKADTLEELAEKIDVDPQVLVETVDKYNSYVDAGHDPDFGKDAFDLKCEVAPFYATPRRPAIHHTMGGLRIDPDTHVLDKDGNVIEGLYAAGEVSGGIHAGNRLGGNALTDIFTFGRIAGENAAKGQ